MGDRAISPPVPMSAIASGPLDSHEFYVSSFENSPSGDTAPPLPLIQPAQTPFTANQRSTSQPPVRQQLRAASGPASSQQHALSGVKSNPALAAARQAGSVKDIANRFNQGAAAAAGASGPPQLTIRTSQDRYRRAPGARSATQRSPVNGASKIDSSMTKLQKRRPGQPRSPQRSPATSFETTNSSFSSNATAISTKSQPHAAFNPKKANLPLNPKSGPYITARPLFGEVTADGNWHANFDVPGYGPLPSFKSTSRRMSEGNVALGHGRSQSHQDIGSPRLGPPAKQVLHHKRSRSEMDAMLPQQAPSMPNLNSHNVPSLYPTPPDSGTRSAMRRGSPTSRIPVSSRRQSQDSSHAHDPHSRSASAMSNHASRHRMSMSPTRNKQAAGKENATSTSTGRSRYQPPPIVTVSNAQSLSAKIVAPLPKTSPPLRSSRPRQPVSSATTSASRARAAERFQGPAARDGRKPSEQWMGKPYDPQKERSKRKIPELEKIDFEARRARIQKAISLHEESKSRESSFSESRKGSGQLDGEVSADAQEEAQNDVDQHQADEMNRETDALIDDGALRDGRQVSGLSLDTVAAIEHEVNDTGSTAPNTARTEQTEFEMDDGPDGPSATQTETPSEQPAVHMPEEAPVLLSAATYQPPSAVMKAPTPAIVAYEPEGQEVQSPSVLENVMRMRERSASSASRVGTDFAEESPSAQDCPSDLGDRWGLGQSLVGDEGSIKIMLDDDSGFNQQSEPWLKDGHHRFDPRQDESAVQATQAHNQDAFATNGYTESPVDDHDGYPDDALQDTPRKHQSREDTLKPDSFLPATTFAAVGEPSIPQDSFTRALDEYQTTGTISPEMLGAMQGHNMVDLNRVSANGGSDAIMVQNLLDSIVDKRQEVSDAQKEAAVEVDRYGIPIVTPDTPPDAALAGGSAVVWGNEEDGPAEEREEEDFQEKIRKADEAWERQQRGDDAVPGAEEEDRPLPPPKDLGYTPRSSTGPNSASLYPPTLGDGLRISTSGQLDSDDIQTAGDNAKQIPAAEKLMAPISAPPLPGYAPPPPPSPSGGRLPYGMPDVPQMPATYSERGSSELSPRVRKNLWGPSGSSRPSTDSQRPPPPVPASQSMSSFADSTRQNSMDTGADGQTKLVKSQSPGPEQKRLMKRRHIIKELLDTENSYHQDLKIIEDIYKATGADLISTEDKKILFGNCDEIEKFSLHFYDELRKSVMPIYVPPKQMRWAGQKRGSYSTTQSDATGQNSMMAGDMADDEKDRATTIGKCFQENLHRMDHVYGNYLKNHDAANARLSALKNAPTVKCWLDECHNNASDITSAWDLDSLLVKPTQRVSKYPMLLQQLLETTAADHPDHSALKAAVNDTISMLTRINDAKKRADIVDQIINRKGKEDVRSGIAKAFGRRTEKLKERVGIAEAFQDPEFDELAHKFGGHFIRLQICMRDVQDYMHRIDRSMDQISNCAAALELFTDVSSSSLPEIGSKWRRYGQAIRDIAMVAFPEHKAAVHKRVIQPMVTCIKLHDGPQNAINKRKQMIVDYAKCKSIEKRGEKPDKKTIDGAEKYEALNHQLKLELPRLYSLTGSLVQGCLDCFLDIQMTWYNMWERKLRPILEASDFPESIGVIEPMFRSDFDAVKDRLTELGICNGALLADSANFLSPTTTLVGDSEQSSLRRPGTFDSSKRTLSVSSETSPSPSMLIKRHSSSYVPGFETPQMLPDTRIRSNSSMSARGTLSQTPGSAMSANRPWAFSNNNTPSPSFTTSRPATATQPSSQQILFQPPRGSADDMRSPRPSSGQTYVTARVEQPEGQRFSGIFSSAMPSETTPDPTRPASRQGFNEDTPVLFVCASLFEFSIDKTRREGGYPYLTYVQGEVFDVVAQKGELWLAKNQDDSTNSLGWIWEQHFVILSQES